MIDNNITTDCYKRVSMYWQSFLYTYINDGGWGGGLYDSKDVCLALTCDKISQMAKTLKSMSHLWEGGDKAVKPPGPGAQAVSNREGNFTRGGQNTSARYTHPSQRAQRNERLRPLCTVSITRLADHQATTHILKGSRWVTSRTMHARY